MKDFDAVKKVIEAMHDSEVERFNWNLQERTIELQVDDFFSNYLGFPEYPGKQGGLVKFIDVKEYDFVINGFKGEERYVYSADLNRVGDRISIVLALSPGGRFTFDCSFIELPDLKSLLTI